MLWGVVVASVLLESWVQVCTRFRKLRVGSIEKMGDIVLCCHVAGAVSSGVHSHVSCSSLIGERKVKNRGSVIEKFRLHDQYQKEMCDLQ